MSVSDQHDLVVPVSIVHGLDAMVTEDGRAFEFHYDYLVYTFQDGDDVLVAKHYMHTAGEVSLVTHPMPAFELPFVGKALLYLGMRYATITYLTDQGYIPIPKAVADELARGVLVAFGRR